MSADERDRERSSRRVQGETPEYGPVDERLLRSISRRNRQGQGPSLDSSVSSERSGTEEAAVEHTGESSGQAVPQVEQEAPVGDQEQQENLDQEQEEIFDTSGSGGEPDNTVIQNPEADEKLAEYFRKQAVEKERKEEEFLSLLDPFGWGNLVFEYIPVLQREHFYAKYSKPAKPIMADISIGSVLSTKKLEPFNPVKHDVFQFVKDLEAAAAQLGWTHVDAHKKIGLVLDAAPSLWYKAYHTTDPTSWDVLKRRLTDKYALERSHYLNKLLERKQKDDERVMEYLQELELMLYRYDSNMNDSDKIAWGKKGLNDQFRSKVVGMSFTDFGRFVAYAVSLEDEKNLLFGEAAAASAKATDGKKNEKAEDQVAAAGNFRGRGRGRGGRGGRGNGNNRGGQRNQRGQRCYACNGYGHFARDCNQGNGSAPARGNRNNNNARGGNNNRRGGQRQHQGNNGSYGNNNNRFQNYQGFSGQMEQLVTETLQRMQNARISPQQQQQQTQQQSFTWPQQ